jgi:hypothetical protein
LLMFLMILGVFRCFFASILDASSSVLFSDIFCKCCIVSKVVKWI